MRSDAHTRMGHEIHFLQPQLTKIDLRDIEAATSLICRYNGHVNWKLVQHLALCVRLAEYHLSTDNHVVTPNNPYPANPGQSLYLVASCAAHDFHEIYIGDIIGPLKQYLHDLADIEFGWELHTLNSLNLMYPDGAARMFVKYIDLKALVLEMIWADHPGWENVAGELGAPTSIESLIFAEVARMTLSECWQVVIKPVRANMENQLE